MEQKMKEIEYSLFGECPPDEDQKCDETPMSVRHWLSLLRRMFYKYEDLNNEIHSVSERLGISDNRMSTTLQEVCGPQRYARELSRVNDNQCCTTLWGKECCTNGWCSESIYSPRTVPCRDWGECSSKVNCWGPYCEEEKCPNHAC